MLPLMDDAIRRLLELEAQIAVLTDRVNKLTVNSEQLTTDRLESVSSKVVSNDVNGVNTDRKAYMREYMRAKRAKA
jgi:3-deoxy-D-manno-octulosonate 8-phosphate phosphatase KdsC-like HAD superfamily phosphatase